MPFYYPSIYLFSSISLFTAWAVATPWWNTSESSALIQKETTNGNHLGSPLLNLFLFFLVNQLLMIENMIVALITERILRTQINPQYLGERQRKLSQYFKCPNLSISNNERWFTFADPHRRFRGNGQVINEPDLAKKLDPYSALAEFIRRLRDFAQRQQPEINEEIRFHTGGADYELKPMGKEPPFWTWALLDQALLVLLDALKAFEEATAFEARIGLDTNIDYTRIHLVLRIVESPDLIQKEFYTAFGKFSGTLHTQEMLSEEGALRAIASCNRDLDRRLESEVVGNQERVFRGRDVVLRIIYNQSRNAEDRFTYGEIDDILKDIMDYMYAWRADIWGELEGTYGRNSRQSGYAYITLKRTPASNAVTS